MFKLIIEDDEGKTTVVPITRDEITIGRKEGNNIRLTERNVSRNHARIVKSNGHVSIEDLDSYNGIRINGDRIPVKQPQGIQEGDLIEIGDYHLAIQLEGSDSPGLAGAGDESTQRVSLNAPAGDEVTSQVAMHADMGGGQIHQDTPPLMDQGGASARAPSPEVTAQMPMSIPPPSNGTAPNHFEPTLEQDVPTGRRAEPTAIIRHSDLAQAQPAVSTDAARLVVVSTNLAGRTFALNKDEMVIGRTDDNDIQIDHRSVSRNHAKIVRDGTRFSVVDLKSANGVLVNGEEYAKMDLRKGDIIELGHVKLRFVEPGETFALSQADIEKLKKEDTDDSDGFSKNEPTGLVTSRMQARSTKAGGPPVKLIAIGVGVVVLLGLGLGIALSSGKSSTSQPPKQNDEPAKTTQADPTPPKQEEPAPTKTRPVTKKEPEKQPEPPPVAEPAFDASRTLKSAQAAVRAGDFEKAQQLYQSLVDNDDPDGAGKAGLAQVAREVQAKQQLDDALEKKESDPRGCYLALGAVTNGTRARERANAEMKALKPRVVEMLLKEARKQMDQDPQAARDIALETLELDRNSREASSLVKEAEKALKAKKTTAAKPAPAPQDNPKKDPAPSSQATNTKAADARKALEDGNRAILLGNFEEAVAKGKQALKQDPSLSEAHKLLGVAYARQSKYCDAKFHYKKFIELNPSSPMVDRIKQILQTPDLQNCQ